MKTAKLLPLAEGDSLVLLMDDAGNVTDTINGLTSKEGWNVVIDGDTLTVNKTERISIYTSTEYTIVGDGS